ncbi:Rieske 2Fe-2S domain-containing protein [Marinithermus hydrothermalis]|uniref:Rieske (2Fe-2S) iron-sulfur domain protein n=1 Tax=Marinithermus hydrothermalis (strain DSM 14884 / JCM 11576 / T1) TaxID=869210 RepID=F2NLV2_MARHT|nr:Rieske (2Fe-2S) iron-sulfur domain protein [Marinithermus hydrothermalis DSM 14884]
MSRKLTRRDLIWILPSGVAAGFFGWFGWRTVRILFLKERVPEPTWRDGERVEVARLEELEAPWAFKYFTYPTRFGELKSVLVRLPGPVVGGLSVGEAHFVGLSRICTHLGCTVNYVPDLEAGAIAYNYRASNPFLGCPCHFGAFDPAQGGKAVFGPPTLPLPRLRLEAAEGVIYATGHEEPLYPIERG